MSWLRRLFHRESREQGRGERISRPLLDFEVGDTRRKITSTMIFALESRDPELRIVEHCAMVSLVAGLIAEQVGVSESDAYILRSAAQLHEIGLLAIPPELLKRPAPLSPPELDRVRAQAEIGAEIARAAHHPRVPLLIRHQYDDYGQLQASEQIPARDLLLAGIFRVADVFAAVTWPRPYQDPLSSEHRMQVLRNGAGTRFHPLAVHFALRLWRTEGRGEGVTR